MLQVLTVNRKPLHLPVKTISANTITAVQQLASTQAAGICHTAVVLHCPVHMSDLNVVVVPVPEDVWLRCCGCRVDIRVWVVRWVNQQSRLWRRVLAALVAGALQLRLRADGVILRGTEHNTCGIFGRCSWAGTHRSYKDPFAIAKPRDWPPELQGSY